MTAGGGCHQRSQGSTLQKTWWIIKNQEVWNEGKKNFSTTFAVLSAMYVFFLLHCSTVIHPKNQYVVPAYAAISVFFGLAAIIEAILDISSKKRQKSDRHCHEGGRNEENFDDIS